MTKVLDELVGLLALEKIEENIYRGQSQDLGWGQVFGGQVVGQALSAASKTVPEGRPVHSLHSYFLRTGDASKPIIYEVDRIRDGRSFTTRRVVAVQNGRPIFNLSASFQVEEPGFEHQDEMPAFDGPDGFKNERELWTELSTFLPEKYRARATGERPIELRPTDPTNWLQPEVKAPRHGVWYRAAAELPDDDSLHRYLLAYCSDFAFLTVALRPHGMSWVIPTMQVASLDHAMWFHRPFRLDGWLLHVIESPSASGARGLVRGQFFDQQGRLVASTMQEGLMRDRRDKD
jgi:acyl-CoA thioesterase-2